MSQTAPATVLVVDDIPENIFLIQQFLQIDGHIVRSAASGEEALRVIEQEPPDLVLLDVMMPGMDGIEVCRRIKSIPDRYLPVVLVTAYGASGVKRQGIEAGAEDFISKPYEPEELIARIRSILKTKRLYNDLKAANRQMEDELEAVGQLQRSLLPATQPADSPLKITNLYLPARPAGGDYFDYFDPGEGRLGIAVGDASGHGPPAAVLMAVTKTVLRLQRDLWTQPSALLNEAARQLTGFVPLGQFITLFYALIDTRHNEMTFASGGHCPPILLRANGDAPELLKVSPGLPLGITDEHPFNQNSVPFSPGDKLFIYTDGLTEAQNGDYDIFGAERLAGLIAQFNGATADEMCRRIVQSIVEFSGEPHFRDDCTLLVVEYPK